MLLRRFLQSSRHVRQDVAKTLRNPGLLTDERIPAKHVVDVAAHAYCLPASVHTNLALWL